MNKLDPLISEFETEEEEAAHTAWVQERVRRALADPRPGIPHDQVMAEVDAIIAEAEERHRRKAENSGRA